MAYIKNHSSLASNDNRKVVLDLMEAAYAAIDPQEVFKRRFTLKDRVLTIHEKSFDLKHYDRVFLLGFGKGSALMCKIIEEKLGDNLTGGTVIDVVAQKFTKLHFTKGTHPLPSQANFDFTRKLIEQYSHLTEKDLVIITTCGGGSVMLEHPHTFSLEQMIDVNKALLHSGATISEMNIVRKHLSQVKGGGLAKILFPATIANLVFSDVPGNDLSVIASGPTVKDPTTTADATTIVNKYNLNKETNLTPENFVETPKEDKYFKNVANILMLTNDIAIEDMQKLAEKFGYKTRILSKKLQGDARTMGKKLIEATKPGEILLAGGETTLKVIGHGKGGRNQALVLSTLPFLNHHTVLAAFGSDGWDFYGFAGAIADQDTIKKAKDMNLIAKPYLDNDDSYAYWKLIGDGIDTGKLESNVSDLYIVFKKHD